MKTELDQWAEEYVDSLLAEARILANRGESWTIAPTESKRDFKAGFEKCREETLRLIEKATERGDEATMRVCFYLFLKIQQLGHESAGEE